jgi:murein DD-endopeptidase MepM/ murein hydrolase activator NlpD
MDYQTKPIPSYHEVKAGETIYSIAKRYGITVAEFQKMNGLKFGNNRVELGKKYIIGFTESTNNRLQRNVIITVSDEKTTEKEEINSYPDHSMHYLVDTYWVYINGTTTSGQPVTYKFKAVRYGVAYKYNQYKEPTVVGLFQEQTHVIPTWKPKYLDDNDKGVPIGAFVISGTWYFHSGSEDTNSYTVGSIGCVEIAGKGEWTRFCKAIKELSGQSSETAAVATRKIKVHIKGIPKVSVGQLVLKK